MGNITTIENYTEINDLNENDFYYLRLIGRILAVICNIPCFLSIFVFLFQDTKLKLGQIIQLRLCITIVLYEASHYFPISIEYQWLCYFQCIIFFGIEIIICYLALIYTYISLIIFIRPYSLSSKCNKFFIYFSPSLLYIGIIFYILYKLTLFNYYQFTVYPKLEENETKLLNILELIFLIINIINNIILVQKIKSFIKKLSNIDHYAKEKLCFFKKKLYLNIFLIFAVFTLPFGILTLIKNFFTKFEYLLFLFGNKALLGVVFWFIYIYNKIFWHKFLILIRIEKKEKYKEKFEEEEKVLEYSSLSDSTIDNDETIHINTPDLEKNSPITNKSNLRISVYSDESL